MSAPEDGSARGETGENADLQVARGELVEVLLRESREELERIDLKASILLSVCSLALAALVHAAAYLHWDPRDLVLRPHRTIRGSSRAERRPRPGGVCQPLPYRSCREAAACDEQDNLR